jgi:hypothetical protein
MDVVGTQGMAEIDPDDFLVESGNDQYLFKEKFSPN